MSSSSDTAGIDIELTPDPRIAVETVSSLLSLGPRHLVMTGAIRQILIQHFADVTNILSASLRNNVWTANEETGILIESATRWVPTLAEKRPAIIIKRNALRSVRLGIGNQMQGFRNLDGFSRYEKMKQCSHTCFCVANEGAEAEELGQEVYEELDHFGPLIRCELGLLRFEAVDVGTIVELEEFGRENFAVPVTVAYAYSDTWTLRQYAPLLKRFETDFELE